MPTIDEATYENYLGRLLAGDFKACQETLEQLQSSATPIRQIYEELFQRSLYEVGQRWERNQISVAVEHLATAITETLMGLVAPSIFAQPTTEGRAVVACVPGELHSIGARMTADILQLNGWNSSFLGANLPADALASYVMREAAALVGLSMSLRFHLPQLHHLVEALQGAQPTLEIVVGGQGLAQDGPAFAAAHKVHWFPNLVSFEAHLREVSSPHE